MSHTGSSTRGSSCLVVVAESVAVLHCVTNIGVANLLPVAIYYFVLYLVYGPPRILTSYQCFLVVL